MDYKELSCLCPIDAHLNTYRLYSFYFSIRELYGSSFLYGRSFLRYTIIAVLALMPVSAVTLMNLDYPEIMRYVWVWAYLKYGNSIKGYSLCFLAP